MTDHDSKVVSLEQARLAKLPMLDTNLSELSDLVRSFVNQCVAMGHRNVCASFDVGKYTAKLDLEIKENP